MENCVGFIDKWMSGDCVDRRKFGCTNGNFLGLHPMIFKNSVENTYRLLSEITPRNMFLS